MVRDFPEGRSRERSVVLTEELSLRTVKLPETFRIEGTGVHSRNSPNFPFQDPPSHGILLYESSSSVESLYVLD